MTSAAAKKAWDTRRKRSGFSKKNIRKATMERRVIFPKRRKFSKVQALMDGFGYSRKEAIAALKDMGE